MILSPFILLVQVIVRLGASKQSTPVAKSTLNPLFTAELKFIVTDDAAFRDLHLKLEVRDKARILTPFGKGDFMGKCEIPVVDVRPITHHNCNGRSLSASIAMRRWRTLFVHELTLCAALIGVTWR